MGTAKKFNLSPTVPLGKMKSHFKFRLENNFALDVFRAKFLASGKGKKISFDEVYERRETLKGETGLVINVPSIDDLIELKKLRSLPKDLEDIKYLEALKEK